jgi:hypothetical protein
VEGSIEDYEEGMRACSEAAKIWMQASLFFLAVNPIRILEFFGDKCMS